MLKLPRLVLLFAFASTGCGWKTWRTSTKAPPLIPIEATASVRIIGMEQPVTPSVPERYALANTAVERTKLRTRIDDVRVLPGCEGRACVRWDDGQPCLTQKFVEQKAGAGQWNLAFRLTKHREGTAEGLVNFVTLSNPGSIGMDMAVFNADHQLVTTQRIWIHRNEDGFLRHQFSEELPNVGYANRESNGELAGGDDPPLARKVQPGAALLARQIVDDGAWLFAWMTRTTRMDLPVPVLLRRAGDRNEVAIEQARAGDVEAAISTWQSMDTRDSRVAFNLGIAYAALGDDRRSLEFFEIAEKTRSRGLSRNFLEGARARESFRARQPTAAWCE